MIEIKHEIVIEIAEKLELGLVCFYHKINGEIESYPDEHRISDFEEEFWADVIDKVEKNRLDYLKFQGMGSAESFKVMEDFINTIKNKLLHNKFIEAISRRKPFRQFSELLINYPELREEWFDYKRGRYIEFVKNQLV